VSERIQWTGTVIRKVIDVKGFGSLTNLAVATANDFDLRRAA